MADRRNQATDGGSFYDNSQQELLLDKPKRNRYVVAISVMASLTSVLSGYDSGVMSGAAIYIKDDLRISDVQVEVLIGTICVYTLIGSLVAGWTSDRIGRRGTIVLAAVFFFAGSSLMGFAPNYAFLMVGRFVTGIGMGYGLMVAPVYAAEVSPSAFRGFLTSFPEVFVNIGLLLGYISNYALSGLPTSLSWRVMLGAGALPSILLILGVLTMPESPRWLVLQGRLDEARRVLDKTSNSREESLLRLNDIVEAAGMMEAYGITGQRRSKGESVWRELLLSPSPVIQHILLVALGVHFFQQASGTDAFVIYSPRIFEKVGIASASDKLLATIAVGCSKTIFTLVAALLVDRVGRRVLLLTSCGGVTASLTGLAIGLTAIKDGSAAAWAVVLCVSMSVSCMAFFSIGMGPVTWVYSSEVFPLRLRAVGYSLGVAVNQLTSGMMLMTFISLYEAISISGAFFVYASIGMASWVFFYTLLPETKGKSLEEMEGAFGGFWNSRLHH